MKRLLLSIVGGVLIPPFCAGAILIIVSIVSAISSTSPFDSKWYWVLCLPLEWAGHLYNHFSPPEVRGDFAELRIQVFLINVMADFVVASMLTYLYLSLRRKRTAKMLINEAHPL
jgi:hypothetical protein